MFGERIDQGGETKFVFKQRGDVVEKNSGLWKVRYLANQSFQMIAIGACLRRGVCHLPRSFNAECAQPFDRLCFFYFNFIHPGRARSLAEARVQVRKLLLGAYRQNLDCPVSAIADPAGNSQCSCFALHKPTEAYALHAATDDEILSLGWIW